MDRDFPFTELKFEGAFENPPSDQLDKYVVKLQGALQSIQAACVIFSCDVQNADKMINGQYGSYHFQRLLKSINGRINLPFFQLLEWVRCELNKPTSRYTQSSWQSLLVYDLRIAQQLHRSLNVRMGELIAKVKTAGCKFVFLSDENGEMMEVERSDRTLTVLTTREILVNILFGSYWPDYAQEFRTIPQRSERDKKRLCKLIHQSQSSPATSLVPDWYQRERQLPRAFQSILQNWQEAGVPRCISYCTTHEISGASVANWTLWSHMHKLEFNARRSRFSPRIVAGLADSIKTHRQIITGLARNYDNSTLEWRRQQAAYEFHRLYQNQHETLTHQKESALAFEGYSYEIKDPCHSCRGIYNYQIPHLLLKNEVHAAWNGKDYETGPNYGVCAESAMHAGCLELNDPLLLADVPHLVGSSLQSRNDAVHNACVWGRQVQHYNNVIEPLPSAQEGQHRLSSKEAQEARGKDKRTKRSDEPKATIRDRRWVRGEPQSSVKNVQQWLVARGNLPTRWMTEEEIMFLNGELHKAWRKWVEKDKSKSKGGPSRSEDQGLPYRFADRGGPSGYNSRGGPSRDADRGGPSRDTEEGGGGGPQEQPDEPDRGGEEEGGSGHGGKKVRRAKRRKGKERKVEE